MSKFLKKEFNEEPQKENFKKNEYQIYVQK